MSKQVDQHIELLEFLATHPTGVSYERLMNEFRCGRSTMYRRLSAIRTRYMGALKEKIAANGETLFFISKSVSDSVNAVCNPVNEDVLWSLRLASRVLRAIGLHNHAQNVESVADAIIANLKAKLRVDQRKALDDKLNTCALREDLKPGDHDFANSRIVSQLCLALHSERLVTVFLDGGTRICGVPVHMTHEIVKPSYVTIRGSGGEDIICHVSLIKNVTGVDDLIISALGGSA
jgi:hypothetical protein